MIVRARHQMQVIEAPALLTSRRALLASIAALGTCGATAREPEAAIKPPHRIDVHRHTYSPPYVAARRADHSLLPEIADGMDPARTLEDMDKAGVTMSVMSVPTAPKNSFGDAQAMRAWSREQNEYLAKIRSDRPDRFGFFATTPLPDVDGALKEIAYALDVLKADGIGFVTNYGD